MSKKVSAVLFDLDGTLIDTAPDFIRIIKLMCTEQGIQAPSDERIREQVSAGSRAMVGLMDESADPNDPKVQATFESFRNQFLAEYEKNICVDTQLYGGMDALLTRLEAAHIPWGIVTNKPRGLSVLLLQALNLTNRCAVLVCPDDVVNAKPHPEPMYLAANTINVAPEKIVYIGDHPRDIEAGNAAGMSTVLAKYGYLPPLKQKDGSSMPMCATRDVAILQSWQAQFMIDTVEELEQILWEHTNFMLEAPKAD